MGVGGAGSRRATEPDTAQPQKQDHERARNPTLPDHRRTKGAKPPGPTAPQGRITKGHETALPQDSPRQGVMCDRLLITVVQGGGSFSIEDGWSGITEGHGTPHDTAPEQDRERARNRPAQQLPKAGSRKGTKPSTARLRRMKDTKPPFPKTPQCRRQCVTIYRSRTAQGGGSFSVEDGRTWITPWPP